MQDNKRHTYRCPVPEEFRSAILKLGRREYLVQLANESAGGFSITCDADFACEPGRIALLQVSSGVFQVEVVHRTEKEGCILVGLKRLTSPTPCAAPPRTSLSAIFASGGGTGKAAGAFTLVLFVLLGASLTLLATSDWFPWGPQGMSMEASISYENPAKLDSRYHSVVAGLNVLTSQDVIARLGLSHVQQDAISDILQQTSLSLAVAYEQWGADTERWEEESGKLVELAARRVVGTLTTDQVQKWSRILHEHPAPTPSALR